MPRLDRRDLAAAISRSISSARRYSRGRLAALVSRRGGTSPFTTIGAGPLIAVLSLLCLAPC